MIQIDSREKQKAIQKILHEFDSQGTMYVTSKLYVGDYMNFDNPRLVIDRKQNLQELCRNVCQDHKRFIGEIKRAKEAGIKLVFLCEHGNKIQTLSDVEEWVNPRLKISKMAVSGERLYKILSTIQCKYGVKFLFCSKDQTGKKILELLGGETND